MSSSINKNNWEYKEQNNDQIDNNNNINNHNNSNNLRNITNNNNHNNFTNHNNFEEDNLDQNIDFHYQSINIVESDSVNQPGYNGYYNSSCNPLSTNNNNNQSYNLHSTDLPKNLQYLQQGQINNSQYSDQDFNAKNLDYQHNYPYWNQEYNYSSIQQYQNRQQLTEQDQLQLTQYQFEINNSNLDNLFAVYSQDADQNYQNQHMMNDKNNMYGFQQFQELIYIPSTQPLENTKRVPVNIVLIDERRNVKYAFDYQDISITNDKTFDINEILELPQIHAYINEDCVITIKKNSMNLFLGKYPIKEKAHRFQRIECNNEIVLLYKSLREDKSIQRTGEMVSYESTEYNHYEQDEDRRMEERTIKEALQQVKLWRDSKEEANQKKPKNYKMISLELVANEAKQCKKKTLDYYFLELRKAEAYGFKFNERIHEKMGQLRQFNQEEQNYRGKIKPKSELEFELPQEFVLPLDQELIERLIGNAAPSSRSNRSNTITTDSQNRVNTQNSIPTLDEENNDINNQEDFNGQEENNGFEEKNGQEEDQRNEQDDNWSGNRGSSKHLSQPLPIQKYISKSKSGSPRNNQRKQTSNQGNQEIQQTYNEKQFQEEEVKFDGSYKIQQDNNQNSPLIQKSDQKQVYDTIKNEILSEDIFNPVQTNENVITESKFFDNPIIFIKEQSIQDNLQLNISISNSVPFNYTNSNLYSDVGNQFGHTDHK